MALAQLSPYVKRIPTENDYRLFACWCAEEMGGADPVVKLVLRGDLKTSCLKQRFGALSGAIPGAMNHAPVTQAAYVVARAEAANPDAVMGARITAHYLAVHNRARPMQRPQWLSVFGQTLERPSTDLLVGTADAVTAVESTIADVLRMFLGNPFAGSAPSLRTAEVTKLLRVPPRRSPQARVAEPLPVPRFDAVRLSKNRILLEEDNGYATEMVVLRKLGKASFRLYWRYFVDEEPPPRWFTALYSGPIRSPEEFLQELDALEGEVEGRWDFWARVDRIIGRVHVLDADFGEKVERAWAERIEAADDPRDHSIISSLIKELVSYGAGDPQNWGITRDQRVEPLVLADGLSISDLVKLSGAAMKRRQAPGSAWSPFVREWLRGMPMSRKSPAVSSPVAG